MELILTAENTLDYCEDEDDASFDSEIKFTVTHQGRKVISLIPEIGAPEVQWLALAEACKSGTDACQDWGPSNGEMSIEVKKGLVTFEAAKYGDGQGGSLQVVLKASGCEQAFRDAATITRTWPHDIHCWSCGEVTKRLAHEQTAGTFHPDHGHQAPCANCGKIIP